MIIGFSSLGCGAGKDVDLCGDCKYSIKIQYRTDVPKVAWLTGDQIRQQYEDKDVKITIRALTRCKAHASNRSAKARPAFMEAALKSGIDVIQRVDLYRRDILRERHPVPMEK
jgi:hypothetical protein